MNANHTAPEKYDDPVGFAVFNGLLCWVVLSVVIALTQQWPLFNTIAVAGVASFIAGIFVFPAFLINAMAVMVGTFLTVMWLLTVLIP